MGFLLATLLQSGCGGTPSVNGLATTATTPSEASTSCTTRVVDSGVKGQTTVVQRGLHSDVRINPATGYPAIAYTEASATGGNLSVMLSYWNGSRFVHEVAAGDGVGAAAGSAQMIRLAFLSNGTPLIFWTTNTTIGVKMVGRSVALSSTTTPTWTFGVVDALGVTSGALEVDVNPLDQVGVFFMHANPIATARGRFVYCLSSCASPTSYSAMTAITDFVDTVGATAGPQSSVGMAWCKVSSTLYYPAVTYVGSGANTRYAVCLASPENCGTTGAWSKLSIIAAGATSIGSKLHIDSSVVGDNPKILARVALGTTLTPYQINQSCTGTPTTFATGSAVGASAAITGNAWMNLLKDSTGRFHVVANSGTASVSYFNQTATTGFATATWNNAGTVDTATLPAAFAGVGGAAIDTANDVIYTSYGATSAPNNLTLGMVSSPLSNPSNTQTFSTLHPNQTGAIQSNIFSVFQHRNVATAQTSAGRPGVAYVDYSAGGATVALAAGRLKYAYRDGTGADGSWIVNVIPGVANPHFPSIAFDSTGRPWIGYWEETTLGGSKRYYLVSNSQSDGSGTWTSYQFPQVSKTTLAAQPAFDATAVAMYTSGGVTYPVLIAANSHATGVGIRSSRLNPSTGTWSTLSLVDGIASGIYNLSADYNSSGEIVVAYYDIASTRAKYNYSSDGGTTWSASVVASTVAGAGQGVSIKLDSLGIPGMSYYNKAGNTVFYNKCSLGSAALCANVAGWSTPVQVNPVASSVGVSGLGNPVNTIMTALNFASSDVAEVYYAQGAGASSTAGLMKGVNTTAAANTFTVSTVDAGINATTAVNSAASVANGALSGFSVSSSRSTSSGTNSTAYIGPGNWLYVTTCGD